MGPTARKIFGVITGDRARYERDGIKVRDDVFDDLEHEMDARSTTHDWYGVPPLVILFGVRILDADGKQRRWPKAGGPHPCSTCQGTGFTDWNVDGTRFPGAADCPDCDGSGAKAAAAKFGAAVRDAIAKDRTEPPPR